MDQLVDSAMDAIAHHLGQVGVQHAGRIPNHAVDNLYRLIAHRLSRTPTGARVLGGLQQQPTAPAARQQARDVLRDEAQADPQFLRELEEAMRWATPASTMAAPGATYGNISNRGTGNLATQAGHDAVSAGRDVKMKGYHIGSIRFGTGGLVGGIALLLSLFGLGTAAVFTTVVNFPTWGFPGLSGDATPCSTAAGSTSGFHPAVNDRLLEPASGCSGGLTLRVDHVVETGGVVSVDVTARTTDVGPGFVGLVLGWCTLTDSSGNTLKADVFASDWVEELPHDGKDHRGRIAFEGKGKLASGNTVGSLTFLHARVSFGDDSITVKGIKLGPGR